MKIGIDLRPLQGPHRYRGIGVYLRNLVAAISTQDHNNEYVFFLYRGNNPLDELMVDSRLRYTIKTLPPPRGHIVLDNLKRTFIAPLQLPAELDCFLLPDVSYGMPKGSVPVVTVCYDLIPYLFRRAIYPSTPLRLLKNLGIKGLVGSYVRRGIYSRQQRTFLESQQVIAISQATKADLLAYLPRLRPDSVSVVPLAPSLSTNKGSLMPSEYGKLGIVGNYLLYIGGADFRKNLPALITAFSQVAASYPDLQLVLVGRDFSKNRRGENPTMRQQIDTSPYRSRIILGGYLNDTTIMELYSKAAALVFPSLYEGFGLTILEAMSHACPVIAYRNSSIPEVAGKAALLLESEAPLAPAIEQLLTDQAQRQSLIQAGLKQAKHFSWEQTAAQTIGVLKQVASVPDRPAGSR